MRAFVTFAMWFALAASIFCLGVGVYLLGVGDPMGFLDLLLAALNFGFFMFDREILQDL
jgi:hypothetical protein